MRITRNAATPSMIGKAPDNFTGTVHVANATTPAAPARVGTALVTFAPGARTVWHTHPAGQTIVITAGQGWVQRDGGPKETVDPGDTIVFAPGEKHWHGATSDSPMSHIAITETVDDTNVVWLEPVADADYA